MSTLVFQLGRILAGHDLAYIYVAVSKRNHVMYVGQTNQCGGPLRRFGQHIGSGANATFRHNLWKYDGTDIEDLDDLELYALALPNEPPYISMDRSCREGVEYLLQKRLQSEGARWKPYFDVVSEITAPSTTTLPEVQELSNQFFSVIEALYTAF